MARVSLFLGSAIAGADPTAYSRHKLCTFLLCINRNLGGSNFALHDTMVARALTTDEIALHSTPWPPIPSDQTIVFTGTFSPPSRNTAKLPTSFPYKRRHTTIALPGEALLDLSHSSFDWKEKLDETELESPLLMAVDANVPPIAQTISPREAAHDSSKDPFVIITPDSGIRCYPPSGES